MTNLITNLTYPDAPGATPQDRAVIRLNLESTAFLAAQLPPANRPFRKLVLAVFGPQPYVTLNQLAPATGLAR
jgi:hypothetical protein